MQAAVSRLKNLGTLDQVLADPQGTELDEFADLLAHVSTPGVEDSCALLELLTRDPDTDAFGVDLTLRNVAERCPSYSQAMVRNHAPKAWQAELLERFPDETAHPGDSVR